MKLRHKHLTEKSIVPGCNYHTTWQSNRAMRFVLSHVIGDKATLYTRVSNKIFTTKINDLIFIMSNHNINKALEKIERDSKLGLSVFNTYRNQQKEKDCYCGHTDTCDCGNPGLSEFKINK